jgi:hypothetical protein
VTGEFNRGDIRFSVELTGRDSVRLNSPVVRVGLAGRFGWTRENAAPSDWRARRSSLVF